MARKILIVDDNESNREELREILSENYEVLEAENGQEALTIIKHYFRVISVILLDIDMPVMDGYELLKQLNNHPIFAQIPSIVVTDNTAEETEEQTLRMGADIFIRVPYNQNIIKYHVRNVIKMRESISVVNDLQRNNKINIFNYEIKNGTYWSPESLDMVILHSYAGGACIFEYCNGNIEVLRVNERYTKEILGNDVDEDEARSLNIMDYMDQENKKEMLACIRQAIEMDKEASCELQLLTGDYEIICVRVTVKVISVLKNRYLFYSTVINASAQTEAVQKERSVAAQLRAIIQNVNGGISAATFGVGRTGYIYVNEQYYTMFGYTKEQFHEEAPNGLIDLIHLDDAEAVYRAADENIRTGKPTQIEYRVRKRDGTQMWVRSNSSACYMEGVEDPVHIAVSYDITKEKEEELRIQMLNEVLLSSDEFYRLNLTNETIEEFRTLFGDLDPITEPVSCTDEVRNKIMQVVVEEDRETVENTLFIHALRRRHTEGENTASIEFRRILSNGELCWVRGDAVMIEDVGNKNLKAFVYIRDIDAEKKDEIAIDGILDTELEAVCVANTKSGLAHFVRNNGLKGHPEAGEVFFFNSRMLDYIRTSIVEADREVCENVLLLDKLQKALKVESPVVQNYKEINQQNGHTIRKRISAKFLDDTHTDIVISYRDISDIYEEEQRQREILKAAADAANEANQAKSEFLSRMSHDMRTPLNAVIGMVDLAKDGRNSPKTLKYLNNIELSGQFLLGLINDVLDLTKIESGKIELHEEPYAIEEFINGIKTVVRPLMKEKNIDFSMKLCCEKESIIVDKLRFNQIFFNLLTNAAKYTKKKGRVEFISERIPGRDGKLGLRFIVRDSGIGMSEEFQKILFEPFSQENVKHDTEMQGSGLGLAIVKNLVQAMGGTICVHSRSEEGSEFTVDLYLYAASEDAFAQEQESINISQLLGLRILVVDDNEINVEIASGMLERVGCHTESTDNGLNALRTFGASDLGYYDAILMDLRMPVMDGLEATRQIRLLDRADAKTIPIIALTADAYHTDVNNTSEAGMNAHISKPIEPALLYRVIAEQVQK